MGYSHVYYTTLYYTMQPTLSPSIVHHPSYCVRHMHTTPTLRTFWTMTKDVETRSSKIDPPISIFYRLQVTTQHNTTQYNTNPVAETEHHHPHMSQKELEKTGGIQ